MAWTVCVFDMLGRHAHPEGVSDKEPPSFWTPAGKAIPPSTPGEMREIGTLTKG